MKIKQQGCVKVNFCDVSHVSPNIVCLEIDLATKYAGVAATVNDKLPGIWFVSNDISLHLDPSYPADSMTIIEFDNYPGWEIFCADQPHRYTCRCVLIKKEAI